MPVYGSGGITGFHNGHLVDGPGIIIGRKGTVGSLYWEDQPFYPIDTVFYVMPKMQLTYCYYVLQTLGLERMNTDAAVPGLNRNNVYWLSVVWSPHELRHSTTVDWQKRESVRARLRNLVRITLRRYKYPPDRQEDAIILVLAQAERLSVTWTKSV